MLSQVAGPIPIQCWAPVGGAPDVLTVAQSVGLWLEGFGFVVLSAAGSTHPSCPYVVNLDGTAYFIASKYPGANSPVGFGWDETSAQPWMNWSTLLYTARTLIPSFHYVRPLPTTYSPGNTSFAHLLDDRRIFMIGGRIYTSSLVGGAWTAQAVEATLNIVGAHLRGQVSPAGVVPDLAGHSLWYFMDPANGFVYLYDATVKAEVLGRRTSLGASFVTAVYSTKHDMFFVVRLEAGIYNLYAYANEPAASAISAPEFTAPPRRGKPVGVRSRVVGADGEPCAGRVVEFTVTSGYVSPTAVDTDEDGYASTTYYPPIAAVDGVTMTSTMVE